MFADHLYNKLIITEVGQSYICEISKSNKHYYTKYSYYL